MECFRHAGTGAVGVCTACGKGLCRGCAREDEGWLHCEGECAKDAASQRQSVFETRDLRTVGRPIVKVIALLLFLAGASLVLLGFVSGGFWTGAVGIVVGGGAILVAVMVAITERKLAKADVAKAGTGHD